MTRSLTVAALLVAMVAGCKRGDPPAWDGGNANALSTATMPPPAGAAPKRDGGASSAGATTSDGGAAAEEEDEDVDAGALPQTHDKPEASGAAFDARVRALFDAIVADDSTKALPFFFPLAAYEQVKAIQHPARDYKYRLIAAYDRDIHDLHREVGSSARFVAIDVPEDKARWVDPGEEYNKIGYYRVYGSVVRYEKNGHERSFRITSMISWRGEWYVVHLGAIK